jgi:hypothetical protein
MNDPVVRAAVLIREAQNILKDYEVNLPYTSDKAVLFKVGEELQKTAVNLEYEFGVFLSGKPSHA